jgi:hypothetical protein
MFSDPIVQVKIQAIQNMKCIFYHFNQTSFGNNQTLSKKILFPTILCMVLHIENEHPSTSMYFKQKLKIVDESRQCD